MPQNLSEILSGSTYTGAQGDKGGLYYLFDGASQANNPANGDIRFNNATFGSVTTVYIDGLTADGATIESFVDTWGDSTSTVKGFLVIKSNTNASSTYCIFEVTGVTTQTGWTDITVQNPVGAAPSDNEKIVVDFIRSGDKGDTGNTGPQGDKGGLNYTFSTSTDTASDPGAGLFRYNNSTLGSVTQIAIDATTTEGTDVSDFIASWDDSTTTTNYGQLVVKSNVNDDATYNIFNITGAITDNTGWLQLTVSGGTGSTIPTNTENCTIEFSRTGDKGDIGNTGPQGDKGGLNYTFNGSTTIADPGAGLFRYNNSTLGSVTQIAIDATTTEGTDVSDFIASWDDSTTTSNYGQIIIKSNVNDDATYNIFNITGTVTDNGGWLQLTVSGGTGSTIPTNTENCTIEFSRTGDKGDTGNTGPIGETGPTSPRGFTVIEPTLNLIVPIFHTLGVTTITNVSSYIGGNTSPSASFDIKYGTDLTAAGTQTVTAGYTVSNTTGVTSVTSFDNATVPANNVVWAEYTALSGVVSFTHTSIFY